jgi:hypothetical protein
VEKTVVRKRKSYVRYREKDVFAIPLGGNVHAYCRNLGRLLTEFYDIRTKGIVTIEEVENRPTAFTVWVSKEPFLSGAWPKLGKKPGGSAPGTAVLQARHIHRRAFSHGFEWARTTGERDAM